MDDGGGAYRFFAKRLDGRGLGSRDRDRQFLERAAGRSAAIHITQITPCPAA